MNQEELNNVILRKRKLAYGVHDVWIKNDLIGRQAKPGQFVIVRISEKGERIPLTIAESNGEESLSKRLGNPHTNCARSTKAIYFTM